MALDDQRSIDTAVVLNEDGCVVFKLPAHEINQGQAALLNWVMRSPKGVPLDLSELVADSLSDSAQLDAFDAVGTPSSQIVLRLREATGVNVNNNPVYAVTADIQDAVDGEVRAHDLPTAIVRKPGIYMEEWGAFDSAGRLLFSNQGLLWINRGLFGLDDASRPVLGPPTLSEVRLALRDHGGDNLLLDNVEFDAAELAQAVIRPLQHWNEVPPPIRPAMDTTSFPFREHWLKGIQGNLLMVAAHNYRRNHLAYAAGGVTVDDKNKEREYLQAAQLLLEEYKNWVQAKKFEINMGLCVGHVKSAYGGSFY